MNEILNTIVGKEILLQTLLIIGSVVVLLFLKNQIILFLTGISKKTKTDIDDIIFESIKKPTTYFITLSGLFFIYYIFEQHYKYSFKLPLSQLFMYCLYL